MLIPFFKSNLFVHFVPVFDVLFALTVAAPLVVTFWSTTWKLYDLFIFPNHSVISGTVSWLFGFTGQMVLMFFQVPIKKLLHFEKWNIVNVLIIKVYALFLGHTFVSFWRGVWSFVDAISSRDLGVVILNIVQNIITLMILRAFRNTLVPPFIILTDQREQYNMRTLLEKYKAFIWHDFWYIHDSNIFPNDLFRSALTSLVIGYSLALICFTAQSFVGSLCEKYDDQKLFIYDAFTVVTLLSAINVWRGVWTIVTYYAGEDIKWNLILNTLAWTSLMIVNCTFSLTAKDVLKDAEKPGRACTKFQMQYFSEMLHHEKTDENLDTTVTQL